MYCLAIHQVPFLYKYLFFKLIFWATMNNVYKLLLVCIVFLLVYHFLKCSHVYRKQTFYTFLFLTFFPLRLHSKTHSGQLSFIILLTLKKTTQFKFFQYLLFSFSTCMPLLISIFRFCSSHNTLRFYCQKLMSVNNISPLCLMFIFPIKADCFRQK